MKRSILYLILCGLIVLACTSTGCIGGKGTRSSGNCKLTEGVSGYGPGGWKRH